MARIRSIKPEFFASLSNSELSRDARLHFIGLWTHVDDEARAEDEPRLLKAAIWPLDDQMDAAGVEKLQAELARKGKIKRYQIDGRRYFSVNGWHHQLINRKTTSKLPPPPLTCDDEALTEDSLRTHGAIAEPSLPDLDLDLDLDQGSGSTTLSTSAQAPGADSGGSVERIFFAWTESTGHSKALLSPERRRVIVKALKRYPEEDLIDAVRGWRHSPHHRGENERSTVYNDIGLLLRSAAHVEKFRDLERNGPAPTAPVLGRSSQALLNVSQRCRELEAQGLDPALEDPFHRLKLRIASGEPQNGAVAVAPAVAQ